MDFLFQRQHIGRGQLQPLQRTLAVVHPLGVGLQAFMATHQVLGQQTRSDQGGHLRVGRIHMAHDLKVVMQADGGSHHGRQAPDLADQGPDHGMVGLVVGVFCGNERPVNAGIGFDQGAAVALEALHHHREAHMAEQAVGLGQIRVHARQGLGQVRHGLHPLGRTLPEILQMRAGDLDGACRQKATHDRSRLVQTQTVHGAANGLHWLAGRIRRTVGRLQQGGRHGHIAGGNAGHFIEVRLGRGHGRQQACQQLRARGDGNVLQGTTATRGLQFVLNCANP